MLKSNSKIEDSDNFSVFDTNKKKPAYLNKKLVFCLNTIKNKALGKRYELSLTLFGDLLSKKINRARKHKNQVANVLSFPLSKQSGEIFINPNSIKQQHRLFNLSEKDYFIYLFIHSCLHLKGMTHGSTMEAVEKRLMKKFSSNDRKN